MSRNLYDENGNLGCYHDQQLVKRGKTGLGLVTRIQCDRCGGLGGSSHWSATGYTCFKCNGKGSVPYVQPLYTAQQLDTLTKRRMQANAKREQAQTARALAEMVKVDALRDSFYAQFGAIMERGERYAAKNEFIADVVEKGKSLCRLTQGQINALVTACDREELKATEQATRSFIGTVGEKNVLIEAAVSHYMLVNGFTYNSLVPLWTFKTDNGSVIRYKGEALAGKTQVGDKIVLTATIKKHYNSSSDNCLITTIIHPKVVSVERPATEGEVDAAAI